MRCARAKKLLHLNRESELPEPVRDRTLRHAASCPACHAELELIRKTEGVLASLRSVEPVLEDPTGLTMAVMRSVEAAHAARKERWIDRMLEAAMPLTMHQRLRFAAALVVVAFFAQSVIDAHRMSLLDERLASVPARAAEPLRALTVVPGATTVADFLRDTRPDEAGIVGIARALGIGPVGTTTLMDRLGKKYPGLFSVSAEDGLDERERAILATEGVAFLKEVDQLVMMTEVPRER